MFYVPFLSMPTIIISFLTASTTLLLLSGFCTLLPKLHLCFLHSCLWSGPWQLLFLHLNFPFPIFSAFLCSHHIWKGFFPPVLLPTLISKFLSKSHTTKPFKSICSFFLPYLVYQHCQATFYYAGNKKMSLRCVPSSQNVNPHMYIQSTLLFSSFLFTICLLIWFLWALRYNFTPVQLIPSLVLVFTAQKCLMLMELNLLAPCTASQGKQLWFSEAVQESLGPPLFLSGNFWIEITHMMNRNSA